MRKAVIPAVGLGTRFLPATKALPKEMLPVVDKPGIQWVVEEAIAAGLTDVLVVTGRTKKTVEDHFDRSPELELYLEKAGKLDEVKLIREIAGLADIYFVRQPEPLGLGHAVGLARNHVGDQPFAVLLPDDLMAPGSQLLARMLEAAERTGGPVVALKRFPASEISAYGVVVPGGEVGDDGLVAIRSLVEKPPPEEAPSDLAVMGRYVLTPTVFGAIDRITPGKGGELQLTDVLQLLAEEGPFHGIVFEGGRYDTGNKLDWLRATIELSLQDEALGDDFREVLLDVVRRAGLV